MYVQPGTTAETASKPGFIDRTFDFFEAVVPVALDYKYGRNPNSVNPASVDAQPWLGTPNDPATAEVGGGFAASNAGLSVSWAVLGIVAAVGIGAYWLAD